jgi:hypothetical protein
VEVLLGEGRGVEGVWVSLAVGEGTSVSGVVVTGPVGWAVNMAAMVWYTPVKFGVAVLMGRLLAEMRAITCHSRKMIPAATASQTTAVSKLNRTGAPLVTDIKNVL